MILLRLALNFDQTVVSSTDAEAVQWMDDLGVTKDLPAWSRTKNCVAVFQQHVTHWIVAMVFHRLKSGEKIRRIVQCYPKRYYTGDDLRRMYQHFDSRNPAKALVPLDFIEFPGSLRGTEEAGAAANPMILVALASHPDEHFATGDGAKALQWMKVLGLIEKFKPGFESRDSLVAVGDHPTHWVIGVAWANQAEGRNREVVCLPKSKYTETDILKIVGSKSLDVQRN